ncbi:1,4-dihydroxy-2-naphthoate polyprenyltransferase [Vagococcus carniphilus]|uniref:1,4-dihydroxy-2-naphthoate polyprenyltransferase n=1 Tax=Vagococcus carniphilus TaxID=218144 RepID=UPI00288D5C7C|nr:1,4-dihydroxy-2-naphthoate polyprenyltransferase [Vagococcus carniphilus]MDT2831347.1 1,4-dihydroxy-2-naphthoate polyprenyltransferase [Vagococcus carniphilus]MDT2840319.1 1,4-dihydroxy-2-naphthoate polyprenyltransferase [Vagococcus carniphilus]MDT2854824.1 1,4-dihydroxy-2-naphthoate polyprenyltransferase [Vagococcus carniphilus]
MTMKVFLELVEIRTKLASLFPFSVGLLFSAFYFDQINAQNMFLFFLAMLVFDMATTAINNLMDFKKAKNDHYQENTNIVGTAKLSEKKVSFLIYSMITFSSLIGIYLTYQTSLLLLAMGGLCFLIGIFYTFGPVPLSRMPLGEIFSGVTMGFGIFFITIYLNISDLGVLNLTFIEGKFLLYGQIKELLSIVWASVPMIFTIANIMLANNLCDLEQDISNHRYTLPYYIGRENGVKLFQFLMYSCYFFIIGGVILGIYHWAMLIVCLSFPIIHKNVQIFSQKQEKATTFGISIKNLIVFNGAQVIGLIVSLMLK